MFKDHNLLRTAIKTLAASSLALAGSSAFAADFPAGTFSFDATKPSMTFDGKGGFRVVQGDKSLVSGTYTVKGDQIVLTDAQGPWACTKEGQQSGSYHWKYEKSVLTFNKINDACADRVGSLEAMKWARQP